LSRKIYGNTTGLKASQIRRIQNIYRRRIPPKLIITPELAKYMCDISRDIRRQVGILVNRKGEIDYVMVGDHKHVFIPDLETDRDSLGRFKGLRCIHTHIHSEPLSQEDLLDLSLLRLDMMVALEVRSDGLPGKAHLAHLLPKGRDGNNWLILEPKRVSELKVNFLDLIDALEEELSRKQRVVKVEGRGDRTILVSVTTGLPSQAKRSLDELEELARSAGITVLDRIVQQRREINPKYLMGKGRLSDLATRSLQLGTNLLIFDQDLNPSQVRSITDFTELRVIDRTQLILDIFAQRAKTREGKIQVEMAQLKYMLPRLVGKGTAMSRLAGGIGGRGPGETKLEIDRRKVNDRINRLKRELKSISKERRYRRLKRRKSGIPVISIVGYTNAGKSTLLNALTKSRVTVKDKLFATLDPTSRRLRFPQEVDAIITDTVGFIRNLPRDLMDAFGATLEELEDADILLHIIDISNPLFEEQMNSVDRIVEKLRLDHIPTLRIFNKVDKVDPAFARQQCKRFNGIAISAIDSMTLPPLVNKVGSMLEFLTRRGLQPHEASKTSGHK
jgi:GTP-binding protein HflX